MKIQILMSTYNGDAYLRTQLDSIIAQTVQEKELLIRDDGSTDDTVSILLEYQSRHPWIQLIKGENIGVQRSFFELLKNSDPTADYLSFADQDDFWMPKKLEKAVTALESYGIQAPALYCSNTIVTDERLNPLAVTVSRIVRKPAFGNALVQNICTGCTAVINRPLADLLRAHMPTHAERLIMHDWWLYLAASCFGYVIYDPVSYIYYRQHGNNAAGAMKTRRQLLSYRLGQLFKPRGEIFRQAEEFLAAFEPLLSNETDEHYRLLTNLLKAEQSFPKRLKLAADPRYFRQKAGDDVVLRLVMAVGKL